MNARRVPTYILLFLRKHKMLDKIIIILNELITEDKTNIGNAYIKEYNSIIDIDMTVDKKRFDELFEKKYGNRIL